jgi:hypothetical protein
VKRQVNGTEELGELFGPGSFIGHGTRVLASRSIVNPDGFARGPGRWLAAAGTPGH